MPMAKRESRGRAAMTPVLPIPQKPIEVLMKAAIMVVRMIKTIRGLSSPAKATIPTIAKNIPIKDPKLKQ